MRPPTTTAAVVLAALAIPACGTSAHPPDPRRAVTALLHELAAGVARPVCAGLTSSAVEQLAAEFGGHNCSSTVSGAVRYLQSTAGERRAIAAATVLPALALPLSPAPYRPGETSARVRVQFIDPLLAKRQFVDLSVRYSSGRWRIAAGLAGMFTILS